MKKYQEWGFVPSNFNDANLTSPKRRRNKRAPAEKENIYASPHKSRIKEQPYRYSKYVDEEKPYEGHDVNCLTNIADINHMSPSKNESEKRDSQINDMIRYSLSKPFSNFKSRVALGDSNIQIQNFSAKDLNKNPMIVSYDDDEALEDSPKIPMDPTLKDAGIKKYTHEIERMEDVNNAHKNMQEIRLFAEKSGNVIDDKNITAQTTAKGNRAFMEHNEANENIKEPIKKQNLFEDTAYMQSDKNKENYSFKGTQNGKESSLSDEPNKNVNTLVDVPIENDDKNDALTTQPDKQKEDAKDNREQYEELNHTPAMNNEEIAKKTACYFNSSIFKLNHQNRCDSKESNHRPTNAQRQNTSHDNDEIIIDNEQLYKHENDIEIIDGGQERTLEEQIKHTTIDMDSDKQQIQDADGEEEQAKEIVPTKSKRRVKKLRELVEKAHKPPKKPNHKPKKQNENIEFDITEQKRMLNKYLQIAKSTSKDKDATAITELLMLLQQGNILPPAKLQQFKYLEMINSPYMIAPIPVQIAQQMPPDLPKKKYQPSEKSLKKLTELERLYSRGSQRSSSSDFKLFRIPTNVRTSSIESKTENYQNQIKQANQFNPTMKGSLKASSYINQGNGVSSLE